MKCPRKMCDSCILAVLNDGTIMFIFESFFAFPPLFPRRDIEKIPFFLAYLKTFKIFFDFPEVDITINKSFFEPRHLDFLKTVYQILGHFHKL